MSKNIELHTNPHVQSAAIGLLAVNMEYTGEEPNADQFGDRAGQAIAGCYTAMGMSENSPFADHVSTAVEEMSDKMRVVLIKAGLLRSDCAEAWQAQKVA